MVAAAGDKGTHTEAGALLAWLQEEFEHFVQPSFGYELQIVLPLGAGRELELSGDALHDLMIRVFLRFYRVFRPTVEEMYTQLQLRLKDADSDDVRMLMTGRGSAFALNDPLIRHVSTALKVHSKGFHRAPGGSAKAVTSWGALALYASRQEATMIEFAGLSGGYALCATNMLDRTRKGAVPLEPAWRDRHLYDGPFIEFRGHIDSFPLSEDLGPAASHSMPAQEIRHRMPRPQPDGGWRDSVDPENGSVFQLPISEKR